MLTAGCAAATGCASAESHDLARAKPVASTATHDRAAKELRDSAHEIVATIGDKAITLETLRHWISINANTQLEPALSLLIHAQWLIGEAAEEGLKVDQARLRRESGSSAPHGTEVRQTRANTGATISDLELDSMANQASDRIYRKLERKIPAVTYARLSAYYKHHEKSFFIPERRDVYILRTATDADAMQAKQEIERGTRVAAIVKKTKLIQPGAARDGLLLGLGPDNFGEPALSKAIFSARPKILSGPVQISLGYYVFEVIRTVSARQRTLAESESEIRSELHRRLRNRILLPFIAAFREKWTLRTNCQPDYVVKYCRQYRARRSEPPEYANVL